MTTNVAKATIAETKDEGERAFPLAWYAEKGEQCKAHLDDVGQFTGDYGERDILELVLLEPATLTVRHGKDDEPASRRLNAGETVSLMVKDTALRNELRSAQVRIGEDATYRYDGRSDNAKKKNPHSWTVRNLTRPKEPSWLTDTGDQPEHESDVPADLAPPHRPEERQEADDGSDIPF
jgi:hypothetical protein